MDTKFNALIKHFVSPKSTVKTTEAKDQGLAIDFTNFYKVFFDVAYYLCFSPFRFESRIDKNGYKTFSIFTWRPQKRLFLIGTFCSVFYIIMEIRNAIPTNITNAAQYFVCASQIISTISKCLTIKAFWQESGTMLEILNISSEKVSLLNSGKEPGLILKHIWRKWVVLFIAAVFLLLSLAHWEKPFTRKTSGFGLTSYWEHLMELSCATFFIPEDTCGSLSLFYRVPLSITTVMGVYHRYLLGAYLEMLLMMSSFTLWTRVKVAKRKLEVELMEKSEEHLSRLEEELGSIQQLSNRINKVTGDLLLFFLAESIVVYATRFHEAFANGLNPILTTRTFIYFVTTVITMLFAADVSQQVQSFKVFLKRIDFNNGGNEQGAGVMVQLILNELDNNVIAIKAGNVFPVTFPVMANVSRSIEILDKLMYKN